MLKTVPTVYEVYALKSVCALNSMAVLLSQTELTHLFCNQSPAVDLQILQIIPEQ